MREILYAPRQRHAAEWSQREFFTAHFLIYEVLHGTTNLFRRTCLKLRATIEDERLHNLSQRVLFANLLHRASNPVDVHRRRPVLVLFHPTGDIRARFEVSAKRENLLQTLARERNHLVAKLIDITIKVSEKGEIERVISPWQAVGRGDIVERLIFEDDNAREVQIGKPPERDDLVIRICHTRGKVHRGE